MLTEIIVELDDRPGALMSVTQALGKYGIDIRGMNVSPQGQVSLVHLIVDDCDQAMGILEEMGLRAYKNEVVGVWVDDNPGSLNPILSVFKEQEENIHLIYPFIDKTTGNIGVAIITKDAIKAKELMKKNRITIVKKEEVD